MAKLLLALILALLAFSQPVHAINPSEIVINEVYYDVDSSHGSETTNEWIELYNPTESSIDISNWTINDNTTTRTIPSTSAIPGKGIVLISPNSSTWDYWTIDSGVTKIVMSIGNGLSNTGDKLILKDSSGTTIDSTSYGGNIDIWNPAADDVAEGHSLERNPGGTDTDSAGDFIDQETPTPGKTIAKASPASPTPTPTPTPTPSPAAKSPSPTPKTTPSPSPNASPETQVLGEGATAEAKAKASPSPATAATASKGPPKVAGILTGSGLILIGLSVGFYLWYKRTLEGEKTKERQDQEQS